MMKFLKQSDDLHKVKFAVTGHRFWPNLAWERKNFFSIMDQFLFVVQENEISLEKIAFLTGVATGVDLWFAEVAMDRGIELHVFTPFKRTTQIARAKMNSKQISLFNEILKYASTVAVVNETFSYFGYQKRNKALVNYCHILLTYYIRKRSGSGNCVRYADEVNRKVIDLKPYQETHVTRCVHNYLKLL